MMDPRLQPGFLGTGASLTSDLSLLAYILLIVPGMLIGTWFARRGMHRPHHKWLMIIVTAVNWALILFLMVASYTSDIDDNILRQPGNMRYLIPTIHGLFGLPAQLLATYVVYRMLREDAQAAAAKRHGLRGRQLEQYWFKSAKPAMRLTLALWLATSALGVITYLVRHQVAPVFSLGPQPTPVATEEITPVVTPEVTDEAAEDPVETPEVEQEELTEPVETPEVASTSPSPEAPVETPEAQDTQPPTSTLRPDVPVGTPEVEQPVSTPESVDD